MADGATFTAHFCTSKCKWSLMILRVSLGYLSWPLLSLLMPLGSVKFGMSSCKGTATGREICGRVLICAALQYERAWWSMREGWRSGVTEGGQRKQGSNVNEAMRSPDNHILYKIYVSPYIYTYICIVYTHVYHTHTHTHGLWGRLE